jgi:hypothetical protein
MFISKELLSFFELIKKKYSNYIRTKIGEE